jgi:hypothetical protein
VQNKGCEFNLSVIIGTRGRRCVPDLQPSSHSDSEMTTCCREFECSDSTLKGEVVNYDPPNEIRQDSATILVNREQKVAARRKI